MTPPLTPTPLRWGILGVAAINQRLLPAFRDSTSSTVVAIASRDLARASAAAEAADIPRPYGSYEALLADPEIDAVYIPLPNHLHAEWTRKAANAGKHILCEKPLTCDAASAQALIDDTATRGVRLMDGFMWPHHPRTHKIGELLRSGRLGAVQKVNATFTFPLTGLPTANIRLQPEAGGGALLDVGCYTTYAIRRWMGAEPVEVYATATYVNDVDVAMSGTWTFADGRTANFDCGFTLPLRTGVEIVGTAGSLRIPNLWIPDDEAAFEIQTQAGDFGHAVEVVTTPGQNQMVHMIDDFAAAVREQRDPVPHPSEAIKGLRVMDALAESARSGRPVRLESTARSQC